MTVLMWTHIAGGSLDLLSGVFALAARKGGLLHIRAGTAFVGSMLVLWATATILHFLQGESASAAGDIFIGYFVATSWVAGRRRTGTTGRFEIIACAVALSAAVMIAWGAFTGAAAPTPVGLGPVYAIAGVCLLAGLLDLNAILRAKLTVAQRISRHLWRMCSAFFIATGSFFLGQQDVMPEAARGSPILFALAFAPFVVMLIWLVRLRLTKVVSRLTFRAPSAPPHPARMQAAP